MTGNIAVGGHFTGSQGIAGSQTDHLVKHVEGQHQRCAVIDLAEDAVDKNEVGLVHGKSTVDLVDDIVFSHVFRTAHDGDIVHHIGHRAGIGDGTGDDSRQFVVVGQGDRRAGGAIGDKRAGSQHIAVVTVRVTVVIKTIGVGRHGHLGLDDHIEGALVGQVAVVNGRPGDSGLTHIEGHTVQRVTRTGSGTREGVCQGLDAVVVGSGHIPTVVTVSVSKLTGIKCDVVGFGSDNLGTAVSVRSLGIQIARNTANARRLVVNHRDLEGACLRFRTGVGCRVEDGGFAHWIMVVRRQGIGCRAIRISDQDRHCSAVVARSECRLGKRHCGIAFTCIAELGEVGGRTTVDVEGIGFVNGHRDGGGDCAIVGVLHHHLVVGAGSEGSKCRFVLISGATVNAVHVRCFAVACRNGEGTVVATMTCNVVDSRLARDIGGDRGRDRN